MWKGSALGGRSNASPFRFDKFDPIRLCSRLLDDSLSHGGKCLAEQELKGFSVVCVEHSPSSIRKADIKIE
jgi:hypothetical protein